VDDGWISSLDPATPLARAAVVHAERMHAGQRRADGTPFIFHPLEVASLLREAGAPDHLLAAGLLHDVIEKTDATASELLQLFGPQITSLVLAVTADSRIHGEAGRRAALRRQVTAAGDEALMLFAADKLSKLRELPQHAGDEDLLHRIEHYRSCLRLLERHIPDCPLVHQLREEIGAIPWIDAVPGRGRVGSILA
jgi:(p)ppGpp synthase/HD superfamily hydrolase